MMELGKVLLSISMFSVRYGARALGEGEDAAGAGGG